MSYLPKEPKDPKKISTGRLAIWIFGGGVAVYLIISGIVGIIQHG